MSKIEHVYTTFIRTTPERLWDAITNPEFTRQYWAGNSNVSNWKKGSLWKHVAGDTENSELIVGEVLESNPPKRLVLTWADPDHTDDASKLTFEITPSGNLVCFTVTHGDFKPDSSMAAKVTQGWPRVLSSLKSLLETGEALDVWTGHTCGANS